MGYEVYKENKYYKRHIVSVSSWRTMKFHDKENVQIGWVHNL